MRTFRMIAKTWQVQEAKNRFSEVMDCALTEGAQTVTRHGKPTVVILSIADYQRAFGPRKSLFAALRECPGDLTQLIGERSKEAVRSIHFD